MYRQSTYLYTLHLSRSSIPTPFYNPTFYIPTLNMVNYSRTQTYIAVSSPLTLVERNFAYFATSFFSPIYLTSYFLLFPNLFHFYWISSIYTNATNHYQQRKEQSHKHFQHRPFSAKSSSSETARETTVLGNYTRAL